jgi:RHS repeat-associated protein
MMKNILSILILTLLASTSQAIKFVTYYAYDQVGNPVAAIDETQGIMATRDTLAYGSEQTHTGNAAAFGDLGFTGQIDRSNNQIVYFNARYYLPQLRRFASPDSVTVVDGDYKHIDRYSYGYGNPVNANDPSGNVAETPWDIANAVIGWGTFGFDVYTGNYWGAAESGAGALYDTVSILVPGLPGGASTVIKGKRAAEGLAKATSMLNKAGKFYPSVPDLRTGKPIPLPSGVMGRVDKADRVAWGAKERGAFIKEWYDKGYDTPRGGWGEYDIHHVQPKEFGGNNDFWNLAPVQRQTHQQEFNPWWSSF